MIKITKRKEPRELRQHRLQKFSSYSNMPKNVKKKVLDLFGKEVRK